VSTTRATGVKGGYARVVGCGDLPPDPEGIEVYSLEVEPLRNFLISPLGLVVHNKSVHGGGS
jgi:hypothetical protein